VLLYTLPHLGRFVFRSLFSCQGAKFRLRWLFKKVRSHAQTRVSILFLAANPTDASRLRSDKEFREIGETLNKAKHRDHFDLKPKLAVREEDITQALLDVQPKIVHFSGHGDPTGELCLEDRTGQTHYVQPDALAKLFGRFARQVNCVLLNACYSEAQARAIGKYIEYVIGMNQAIDDEAAIVFACGFYQALGAGQPIEEAYKTGCRRLGLQNIPDNLMPVLTKKGVTQPRPPPSHG
jgi:hypothetical protein